MSKPVWVSVSVAVQVPGDVSLHVSDGAHVVTPSKPILGMLKVVSVWNDINASGIYFCVKNVRICYDQISTSLNLIYRLFCQLLQMIYVCLARAFCTGQLLEEGSNRVRVGC